MLFQIGHTLALPKNQLRIRVIDFYRWDPSPHETYSYVIAPYNLQPGTIRSSHANLLCIVPILISVAIIRSFRQSPNSESVQTLQDSEITKVIPIEKGNCMPLKLIPVGTTISCIGLKPDGPAILCRSAGVSAQLVRTGEKGYAQVKLKSGEVRLIHVDCCAKIGTISNLDHQHGTLRKAGRSRWLGVRPTDQLLEVLQ
ncbi:unnamed protein product [Rhizophagus irregularis]|nr:unnamed protein product [Rhizophagus irregularis]